MAALLGIRKFKITGGEPLVRKGAVSFIKKMAEKEGIEEINLTTNGTLISKYGQKLREAGIKKINISLDTLSRKKYHRITRRDMFLQVMEGIKEALGLGFSPLKFPLHVRFIEYMPMGNLLF